MASNNVKYTTSAKLLYHVVAFMEGYNLDATAACMCAFETSLGLSASRLSIIYAVEKMSLLGIGAVWGVLMDMAGRKCNHVCTLGMLLCGMGCILLGCTSSYPMVSYGLHINAMADTVLPFPTWWRTIMRDPCLLQDYRGRHNFE